MGKAKAKVGEEDDDQTDHRRSRDGSYLESTKKNRPPPGPLRKDKGKAEYGEEGYESVQINDPCPSSGHSSYLERPKKNRPPAGPSRKDKGKAAGEDVNQIQRNDLGPSYGHGSYLERPKKNRPPAGPWTKDKGKAAGEDVNQIQRNDLGPSYGFRGYIRKQEIGSPSKKCKFGEVSNTISGDDPDQSNQLVPGSGDGSYLERPKKNKPPAGLSRKDKGKAEAGEEPGPSSGFRGCIRKQEVGSPSKKAKFGEIYTNCGDYPDQSNQLVLGFGLSARDVNPNNVVQYHDAHVKTIILEPIKMYPRLVARPKEIHVWDIDKRRYNSSYGIRIVSVKCFASEDMHFALRLMQKNFAKILLYKREGSYVHMAHVWNPLSSLSTYCVEAPLKSYRTSHSPSSVYLYLSDTHRTFIRDIIHSTIYLHKSDRSLGGFSIENLIVVNDSGCHKIEFWGVLFYQLNDDREKADFFSIAQVVKAIVPDWETIFLVKDLVRKLEGYSSSEGSVLIVKHLALLSATEKMCFARNCVDKKPPFHYKWYSNYRKALKGMGSNTGWTNKYRVKHGKGPLYSCFWFGRGYKDGCSYDSAEKNESMLSFSRNMSAHLKQYIDADWSLQHPEVNDEHVSSTIFNEFEKQLTSFQEELQKNDILEKFSE